VDNRGDENGNGASFLEFWELPIGHLIQGQPLVGGAGGANTAVTLFLKRPEFRRGVARNVDLTPEHRLINWFGKQGRGLNAVDGVKNELISDPGVYERLMKPVVLDGELLHDAEKLEDIGNFYPEWGLGNKYQFPQNIGNQSRGDDRHLSQLRIHIDAAEAYQAIAAAANDDFIAFVLRPSGPFPDTLPVDLDRAAQLGPIGTDTSEDMFILMQKKQITFDGGTQELRLQRGALQGAGLWANGKPYFCPLSQIVGVRDPANGNLVQENAADMSAGLLTRLTHNEHTATGTPNPTFRPATHDNQVPPVPLVPPLPVFAVDGVSEVTGTRNSFVNGTKSLYMTDDANRYWQHDVRYRPWLKLSYRVQYDVNPINGVPVPGSSIIAESYDLFTQPAAGGGEHAPVEANSTRAIVFVLRNSTAVSPVFKIDIVEPGTIINYDLLADLVKTNHWDQYLKTLPDQAALDADFELEQSEDQLYQLLSGSWSGRVLTIVPFFRQSNSANVCVPENVENEYALTLREKLFGYKTVGFLKPFKIFNDQFGEFFPLALQDYNLTFNMQNDIHQLIGIKQLTDYGVKNIISDESRIYIRSKDGENQDNKELEKIDYSYPEIQRYTSITSHAGETGEPGSHAAAKPVVMCRSGCFIPDYFFVYAERHYTTGYSHEPPKIAQLEIRRNQQSIRMYHDTVMTKRDILDITRRNSHPRADQKQLFSDYGGVLISKYDLGKILDDQLETNLLELEFTVTLEREPSEVVPVGLLPDMEDVLDDQYQNADVSDAVELRQTVATARYAARIQKDTQTTVLFIWGNGSNLQGKSRKMEFKKIAF
jgi:hypothetical protein